MGDLESLVAKVVDEFAIGDRTSHRFTSFVTASDLIA
jgi:hypothetical protein